MLKLRMRVYLRAKFQGSSIILNTLKSPTRSGLRYDEISNRKLQFMFLSCIIIICTIILSSYCSIFMKMPNSVKEMHSGRSFLIIGSLFLQGNMYSPYLPEHWDRREKNYDCKLCLIQIYDQMILTANDL